MKLLTPIIAAVLLLIGCKAKQPATAVIAPAPPAHSQSAAHMGHLIIYRTRADYSQYVSVTLTDDGSAIASYPAPTDVYYRGVLAKPNALADGYWLDNRGVNTHTVFINLTYEQYALLKDVPAAADLYRLVLDKSPLTDIYDLGPRGQYKDEVKEINAIIIGGKLKGFKKLL